MTRHDDDEPPLRRTAWRCRGDWCGADDCEKCHPLGEGAWVSDEDETTNDETEVCDDL